MALSIKTTVAPASEPVSVQALKRHLRVDWPDDDEYLADLITSAREWCESKLNRALITRTLEVTFDLPIIESAQGPIGGMVGYPPRLAFELPYAPLYPDISGVTAVDMERDIELWQSMTLAQPGQAGDYLVDNDNFPPRVWLHSSSLSIWMPSWDWTGARTPRLRITYTAGYGPTADTVPGNIKSAIRKAAAFLYENREEQALSDGLLPTEYLVGWL